MEKILKFEIYESAFPDITIRANDMITRVDTDESNGVRYRLESVNIEIKEKGVVVREYNIPNEIFDVCKKVFLDMRESEYEHLKTKVYPIIK